MTSIDLKTPAGGTTGSVELDDTLFGIEPNVPVMHQVVVAQMAAARAGTQSTKTRAEVRGGGRKPWRQKGTGNARQGSIRSPQWRGGGVAHGPKPRSYDQRTPKKMKRLALASALSDRAADNKVIVVDGWNFDAPKTADAARALKALGATGRVLVVLRGDDAVAARSFRNLEAVHVLEAGQLNTYDVLVNDFVVFTESSLPRTGDAAEAAEAEADEAPAKAAKKATKKAKADEPEATAAEPEATEAAQPEAVESEAVEPEAAASDDSNGEEE